MARKTGRKAGRHSRKATRLDAPVYDTTGTGKQLSAKAVRQAAQDAAAEAEYRARHR